MFISKKKQQIQMYKTVDIIKKNKKVDIIQQHIDT